MDYLMIDVLNEAAKNAKARGKEFIGNVEVYAVQETEHLLKIGMIYGDMEAWRRIDLLDLGAAVAPRSFMAAEWNGVIERLKKIAPLAELETEFATRH